VVEQSTTLHDLLPQSVWGGPPTHEVW